MSTIKKILLYFAATLGLTALSVAVRTAAFFTAFDTQIGYFAKGAFLPTLQGLLFALVPLAALALPFLINKGELALSDGGEPTLAELASGVLLAGACALCTCLLLLGLGTVTSPLSLLLPLVSAVILVLAAIYLIAPFFGARLPKDTLLLCGYGAALAPIFVLIDTYFDLFTQMNAPHKLGIHFALIACALYFLYEVRLPLGRPLPRALLYFSATAFFFCTTVGISDLFAYACGFYDDFALLKADIFCLAAAAYIGARTAARVLALRRGTDGESEAVTAAAEDAAQEQQV